MPVMSRVTSERSAGLAAQQRDNALDRDFDIRRRAQFAGVGIEPKQALAGFDLARLGKLHADDPGMAPCDAAPAQTRIEYRVPTPRHYATQPRKHHSTVTNRRTWKS